jgi:hypothetical protein
MTQDIVERLRMISSAEDHLSRRSETEREAADTIAALRAEVARLTVEREQGARDYCDLMDRHDAHFTSWQSAKARAERAEAELAAARAARTVKVKPLVWVEAQLPSRGGGKYTADAYTIRKIEGLWLLDFAGTGRAEWRFTTLDAAKAAAQADYEARILAALEMGVTDDRA